MQGKYSALTIKYMQQGFNCAEAAFISSMKLWEIDFEEKYVSMLCGFGAGFGAGEICGVISGCVAAISYRLRVIENAHASLVIEITRSFVLFIKRELESINCEFLRPLADNPFCTSIVVKIMNFYEDFCLKEILNKEAK